jgi:hypothetical protein
VGEEGAGGVEEGWGFLDLAHPSADMMGFEWMWREYGERVKDVEIWRFDLGMALAWHGMVARYPLL